MRQITTKHLLKAGMCSKHVRMFRRMFGKACNINLTNGIRAAKSNLDIFYFLDLVVDDTVYEEEDKERWRDWGISTEMYLNGALSYEEKCQLHEQAHEIFTITAMRPIVRELRKMPAAKFNARVSQGFEL